MTTTAEHPQRVGRLAPLLLSSLGAALLGVQAVLSFNQPGPAGGGGGTGAVTAAVTIAVTVLAVAATVAIGRAAALALPLSVTALVTAIVLQVLLGPAPPRFIALVPLALATALQALPVAPTGERSVRPVLWGTLALALHAAVGFPYLTSGLVAPPIGVLALWLVWGAFLALILRLLRTRAPLTLLVPPVALAVWFAALSLGEALFGWSP